MPLRITWRSAKRSRKIDEEHGVCSNKLFYLSVPPQFYDEIFTNIHKARLTELCDASAGGWTRVVVEKPFGSDEKSAKALDERIARLFREEQVYRIDHYLAKETLQNILAFRFLNNLFEDNWGRDLIEKINVRELENVVRRIVVRSTKASARCVTSGRIICSR